MSIHLALLRAVNVVGPNPVVMTELRDPLTELGFVGVRSLLQTGNLVFVSNAQTGAELEAFLGEKRYNLRGKFEMRSAFRCEQDGQLIVLRGVNR